MKRRHLLLTGKPGIGKTTLIRKLASALADRRPAGFYTEEVRSKGVRQGFRLLSLDGREGLLSHVRFESEVRVGKYRVDVEGFEAYLESLNLPEAEAEILFIDEIGKMECCSSSFPALVRELLDSEKLVVATVAARGRGFIEEVKRRGDCEIVEVRFDNRDRLNPELAERIRGRIGGKSEEGGMYN